MIFIEAKKAIKIESQIKQLELSNRLSEEPHDHSKVINESSPEQELFKMPYRETLEKRKSATPYQEPD